MAESPVAAEQGAPPLSRGRDAIFGAGKVLGILIKWMIYGWAARLALGLWGLVAFVPAFLVYLALGENGMSMILAVVIGLLLFILVGAGIDTWTDFTNSSETTSE